ncbi:cytochrome B [Rhizobiales bacterium L72]|uniref:Cytochrome B n=2 Tax=Propylenella binzhouense TaxID=2555902 RepID=A0A964T2T4_9HYPH|nr:cytochrome B [Propylenella binzhouense]
MSSLEEARVGPGRHTRSVAVWDPLVRIGHWVLVGAFAVAYLTEGEPLQIHTWSGYAIAITVALRILWGFVGPRRARFADFVVSPSAALAYLRGLVTRKSPRFVGHSPAGGLMVVMLLVALLGTAGTGMATLAIEKNRGPLAPYLGSPAAEAGVARDPDEAAGGAGGEAREEGDEDESAMREVHALLANLTLALIAFHVLGVAVASWAHRENLVAAMVTGRKKA